jgi:pimeloyl-ACP methyl ester carboxylesterase
MTSPASERAPLRVVETFDIHGVQQTVHLAGDDPANPAILVVLGPGADQGAFAELFAPWRPDFTVAVWTQPIAPPLTFQRLARDGIAVAEAIRTRLDGAPLVLFASSGGSIPGLMMAKARPNLFSAYVGNGQVVDWARQAQLSYAMILERARAVGDAAAVAAIEGIGPPPWASVEADAVRGQYANALTSVEAAAFADLHAAFANIPPGMRERSLAAFTALKPEMDAFDARALGPDFHLPMVFLQGEEDAHLVSSEVEAYAAELRAPSVDYVPLPGLGHMSVFMAEVLRPHLHRLVG